MNARRSLSCLVDQYLLRDGFSLCKDAPRGAGDKADLLVKRGIFDELAAGALGRVVDRRNRIEHFYERADHNDARDTVQLVRATIESSVAKSDPYRAPAIFGSILGGYSGGEGEAKHWFHGWSGLLVVFARCDRLPWLGVAIPSTKTSASIRRVALHHLSCDQLLKILAVLEQRGGLLHRQAHSSLASPASNVQEHRGRSGRKAFRHPSVDLHHAHRPRRLATE